MIARCWDLSKQRVNTVLVLLIGLVFIYSSMEGFWTDSEMWAAVVAKYMFQNDPHYLFSMKPLFNFVLWFNFQWASYLDLHPMVTGRFLMAINGLISGYFVSQIILLLTKDRRAALLGFVLLFAFSTFVKRGGHIRSDLLVSTFLLVGIYFCILKKEKSFLPSLFWALAILISPKAAFFSVPLIVYLFFHSICLYKKIIFYLLLFVSLLIFLITPLKTAVINSWSHFLFLFATQEMGFDYFSPLRFTHIIRFIKENILWLIFFLGTFVFCFRSYVKPVVPDVIKIPSMISLGLLAFYPDRLPFLIASVLPFLTILLVLLLFQFWQKKWVYNVIIMGSLLSCGYWSRQVVLYHSNQEQRQVADLMDQVFITFPELTIWDTTGILARSNANYFFLGPAQQKDNYINLYRVKEGSIDVFLYTSKAFYLEPELSAALRLNYANIGGGVFLKTELGDKVDAKRLKQLKAIINYELKERLLTKLYRFDFEY